MPIEEASEVRVSREQLHRIIDHLPSDKLPALEELLDKLINEDDELISDEEIARYRRIRDQMKSERL